MGIPLRLGGRRKSNPAAVLADAPGIADALNLFSRERGWINERHLALCRIPAPTFLEQARADWMASEFNRLGWVADLDRAGNVVARLGTPGPSALTAHLDTVLAPRNADDIRVASDGRFLGPGVSDNGAGLAGLIAVARAWRDHGGSLPAPPLLVATVGEEGEGNLSGMRYLCRQSLLAGQIRYFVVLDGPASEHITARALASRRLEVAFAGPGGHSWSDYGTANPVHALAAVIADFSSDPSHLAGPKASVNFGLIEGGASVNSIPCEARAKLDIRSENQERLDEMAELLKEVVDRALAQENQRAAAILSREPGRVSPARLAQSRVSARIKELGTRPGGRLPGDSALLAALRSADDHLGLRSQMDCASTDANIPLSMGLQAVSIGAGGAGGGAHTPGEWFHPEGREIGLKRILLTLVQLAE
jgi:acetylornithine deacetylase/succinyl-diaminopimelate desuccinylase-like protein